MENNLQRAMQGLFLGSFVLSFLICGILFFMEMGNVNVPHLWVEIHGYLQANELWQERKERILLCTSFVGTVSFIGIAIVVNYIRKAQ